MQVSSVSVTNIRSIAQREQQLFPVTAFVGKNGVGKTSLLLAIELALLGRTEKNDTLVRHGTETAKVVLTTDTGTRKAIVHNGTKKLFIDNIATSFQPFLTSGSAVSFFPEDLLMLALEPKRRRRWIDLQIARENAAYYDDLVRLARILKQRGALLRDGRLGDSFAIFTEEAATLFARIHTQRKNYLASLAEAINIAYQDLAGGGELRLAINGMDDTHTDVAACQAALKSAEPRDLRTRETTFGTHRVDLTITISDVPAQSASRGEARTASLALLIASLARLRARTDIPIVLLDDVFSELDRSRQQKLHASFGNSQIIMTTTKREHIDAFDGAQIIEL